MTKEQVSDAPSMSPDGQCSAEEETRLFEHNGVPYTQEGSVTAEGQPSGVQRQETDRSDEGRDTSGPTTDEMTRSEEDVHVGTRERQSGRVRLASTWSSRTTWSPRTRFPWSVAFAPARRRACSNPARGRAVGREVRPPRTRVTDNVSPIGPASGGSAVRACSACTRSVRRPRPLILALSTAIGGFGGCTDRDRGCGLGRDRVWARADREEQGS